ncbi:BT_3987 domain-containing protein [Aestuariibaculum sediminum]|uniref:DUF1735 domain-containing protein n=1 Tax=Aestuariibaculum sediminum TaxID=2770637 RepID=A0A8J6Q146_9FLAO|nr:DUF1735 domain-containing protein [Aestuariibaculum sediminum]MBD0833783.1 DUF1735 domain-containing protein [Aestuariibaculum sediminum]
MKTPNGIFISPTEKTISEPFDILFLDYPSKKDIAVSLYDETKINVNVSIDQNNDLVEVYNESNNTSYQPLPIENVTFSSKDFIIEAGTKVSNSVSLTISTTNLNQETIYLLPLEITNVSDPNIPLDKSMNRKYYVVQGGPPPNIAIGKPTMQSSTISGAISSRAVDGNTSGFWSNGSVSHTGNAGEEWWEVDLEKVSPFIQEVILYNRQDCCSERLVDFYVFVSDIPFESNSVADILNQEGVYSYFHAGVAGYQTIIPVTRTGRYVRVQLTGNTYLSLAEVEILGVE